MKTRSTKSHRKSKAALAACAVASTVAATAAYRRHNARRTAGPEAGLGATQPL